MNDPAMSTNDTEDQPGSSTLRGLMRWWRGLGLGLVLIAVLLFSRDQNGAGYAALVAGWVVLIYAIIVRTRHKRRRMEKRED